MPKLPKAQAKTVSDAESGFAPLDEGIFEATLLDVTTADGPAGEYWRWEFGELVNQETGEAAPGRQWLNTSLSEKAAWKLKEAFEAFGADPSTDTDELIGQHCRLAISQRVIEKGPRMGDIGNQVDRVMPLEEADAEAAG